MSLDTWTAPCQRGAATAVMLLMALAGAAASSPAHAADTSAAQQLAHWNAQAGAPGQAARGEAFFTKTHGGEWSCSSCHGHPPVAAGKHARTGKRIDPMAPAANPQAFTDSAKVDKWFRRNCKDVLQRECSASEKADVLAYLTSVRP